MRKTFVETREFTEWVKGYLADESAENWSRAMEFNRFDVSAKELVWEGAIAPVPQVSAESRWFSTQRWLELAIPVL